MKTTIEIPDALATEAKRIALSQGTTLRELVVVGLRAEVARRDEHPAERTFRFRTVGGRGMRAEAVGRPVSSLAYDLPE
ncbi:type II toxin-antitoxin system VapB family antitoxin [Luteipulveratus mongoliensis]|uniref:Antitoxin n=1 Tax=Luteipulveratus mongoliensis TaxID=571913 RepID=A0A0K1JFS8_9MICO|nr:type II toxin-antitoxin system VapB family antitoxin [Luteipulveratus mongoliensis]AKU15556.1 hypothetical protein VV02_06270 [Luteipulveratus mongoliensis]